MYTRLLLVCQTVICLNFDITFKLNCNGANGQFDIILKCEENPQIVFYQFIIDFFLFDFRYIYYAVCELLCDHRSIK